MSTVTPIGDFSSSVRCIRSPFTSTPHPSYGRQASPWEHMSRYIFDLLAHRLFRVFTISRRPPSTRSLLRVYPWAELPIFPRLQPFAPTPFYISPVRCDSAPVPRIFPPVRPSRPLSSLRPSTRLFQAPFPQSFPASAAIMPVSRLPPISRLILTVLLGKNPQSLQASIDPSFYLRRGSRRGSHRHSKSRSRL